MNCHACHKDEIERDRPPLCVLMGVSGCGKSTVGSALETELRRDKLSVVYLDADDFHTKLNVDKMSKGHPLTDEDRWPWLHAVAAAMSKPSGAVIMGCSALKKEYRDFLVSATKRPILFVHLSGSFDLILKRIAQRQGHFMSKKLLESQFDDLEQPDARENAITVNIAASIGCIVSQILPHMSRG